MRCWWGRGAGRWGRGAEARARSRGPCLRAAQPASRGICCGLAYGAYLGLLFRHGCAATVAASAAGTGGTGAGESRSLPRRSPAATVAGPRFIPKSRRAGWPRGVTWPGACTRRVPRAAGARWPAATPDGCECVTGRVRRPGARRDPGTRDSRAWAQRPRMWVQGCAATRGAGTHWRTGALVLGQEPAQPAATSPSTFRDSSYMHAAFGEERTKKLRPISLTLIGGLEDQEESMVYRPRSWNRPLALNLNVTEGSHLEKASFKDIEDGFCWPTKLGHTPFPICLPGLGGPASTRAFPRWLQERQASSPSFSVSNLLPK